MKSFRNSTIAKLSCAASLTVIFITGCGGGETRQANVLLKPVPVKGSVRYKGKPLEGGTVRFEPEDGGREAAGNIASDGTFELTTFQANDGAVAGTHRVAIDPPGDKPKSLPAKYRSAASSGIVMEVSSDKTEYVVDLK
jgi:hypothetical protein